MKRCPDCLRSHVGAGPHLGQRVGGTQFDCIGRVLVRPKIEARRSEEGPRAIGSIRLPGNTAAARVWNDVAKRGGR